jgi:hypothetical protein
MSEVKDCERCKKLEREIESDNFEDYNNEEEFTLDYLNDENEENKLVDQAIEELINLNYTFQNINKIFLYMVNKNYLKRIENDEEFKIKLDQATSSLCEGIFNDNIKSISILSKYIDLIEFYLENNIKLNSFEIEHYKAIIFLGKEKKDNTINSQTNVYDIKKQYRKLMTNINKLKGIDINEFGIVRKYKAMGLTETDF